MQGRIDPADLSAGLKPLQADAHEVIALRDDRLYEMRSQEDFQLVQKPVEWSRDLVDVAVGLVNSSAKSPTNSQLSQREANNGTRFRPQAKELA